MKSRFYEATLILTVLAGLAGPWSWSRTADISCGGMGMTKCTNLCMRGDANACIELGRDFVKAGQPLGAQIYFDQACSRGSSVGCRESKKNTPRARAEAERLKRSVSASAKRKCAITAAQMFAIKEIYGTLANAEPYCRPKCENDHDQSACMALMSLAVLGKQKDKEAYYSKLYTNLLAPSPASIPKK